MPQIKELEAKIADLEAVQQILFPLLLRVTGGCRPLADLIDDTGSDIRTSLKDQLSEILRISDSGKATSAQG